MDKYEKLKARLKELGSVLVSFSGGIDSTFLLTAAVEVLGDNACAVTGTDESFPERELEFTRAYCREKGIRHYIVGTDPMKYEGYRNNTVKRCYYCKKSLFAQELKLADKIGVSYVAEGSNADDSSDYRPGALAACELGIVSPLKEAGFTKEEIRECAKALGISIWDKPAYACLASRFVYGEEITADKLKRIEIAENLLSDLGFEQRRVRLHGNLARIEVRACDIHKLAEENTRARIVSELARIGFDYVTADLAGYIRGSMNIFEEGKK